MKKILESVDDLLLGTNALPVQDDPTHLMARHSRKLEGDLLKVQEALARLTAAVTEDPVLGVEAAPLRQALIEQRQKKLQEWGALALKWFLSGGHIKFTRGTGEDEEILFTAGEAVVAKRTALATSSGLWRRSAETSEYDVDEAQKAIARWDRPSRRQRQLNQDLLQELLDAVGEPPGELDNEEDARDEVMALVDAMDPEELDRWRTMPREVQRCLVGLLVARARHIQDEMAAPLRSVADPDDRLSLLFSTMTGYSKQEQPGFVFGLQRNHRPETGHWSEDAFLWWKQLQAFLNELAEDDDEEEA